MTIDDVPAPRFAKSGIEYLEFGDGTRGTVIFAHGFRDSARGWALVCQELVNEGWRALAVQRRAASLDENDSGRLLEVYAGQVLDVVDAATVADERIVMVGQSMGGQVAELAASRLGSRVCGLMLVNPAPLGGTPLPPEVLANLQKGTQVTDPVVVGEGRMALCVRQDPKTKLRLITSTAEETAASAFQSLSAWVGGHEAGLHPSSVSAPALLVTTDDQFFTDDLLRKNVATRFIQIRVEAVHGAGHYPHLELPVELARVMARFLDENDRSSVT